MQNATADRANVVASPTLIFAGILVLGFGLDMMWPVAFLPAGWGLPLGLIVIFIAVNIKLFAVREMVRVKTHLDIRKPATDIATSGIYGVSRNPLYIGMILLNIGIGCIVNSVWIFLLSAGLAAALQKGVVEPEESYLEQKFGDKYLRYKAKVRRWI
ncbi:MAG TPA: isoprenylcysteine carboxylmethyltransferase family protein [Methylocella sp.]|jgi:protein-S-isoprenylcysteine O-methyltransferase Ste14